MQEDRVLKLERWTTQYVELEDRMRLNALSSQGEVMVLWLTQRLLIRLVPYFCQWLEAQSDIPSAVQSVHHGFAQQAAQLSLQQSTEPEVQVPTEAGGVQAPALLVYGVEVSKIEGHITLGFKDAQGQVHAQLPLPAQALRQWLQILHSQYIAAQWPTTGWPEWLLEHAALTSAAPSGSVLLH
jgi:hypothetical protein